MVKKIDSSARCSVQYVHQLQQSSEQYESKLTKTYVYKQILPTHLHGIVHVQVLTYL